MAVGPHGLSAALARPRTSAHCRPRSARLQSRHSSGLDLAAPGRAAPPALRRLHPLRPLLRRSSHPALDRGHRHRRRFRAARRRAGAERSADAVGGRRNRLRLRGESCSRLTGAAVSPGLHAPCPRQHGADHSGGSRSNLGQSVCHRPRPAVVALAVAIAELRRSRLRRAVAAGYQSRRSTASAAETVRRPCGGALRAAAAGASPVRPRGGASAVQIVPHRQHLERQGADLRPNARRRHVLCQRTAAPARRRGDGGHLAAAQHRRRCHQHRPGPARQNVGQPELHRVAGDGAVGHPPVRRQARHHGQALHRPRAARCRPGRRADLPGRHSAESHDVQALRAFLAVLLLPGWFLEHCVLGLGNTPWTTWRR